MCGNDIDINRLQEYKCAEDTPTTCSKQSLTEFGKTRRSGFILNEVLRGSENTT